MRPLGISFLLTSVILVTASGQTRPDFSGKWQSADDAAKYATLDIQQKNTSIHVVRTSRSGGKESKFEFNCTTDGKDCDASGTKVSLWYDGASLVEMDVSDSAVSTTRLTLDSPGSISVTVTNMSPKSDKESFVLKKI
jgi:hypothetical protein